MVITVRDDLIMADGITEETYVEHEIEQTAPEPTDAPVPADVKQEHNIRKVSELPEVKTHDKQMVPTYDPAMSEPRKTGEELPAVKKTGGDVGQNRNPYMRQGTPEPRETARSSSRGPLAGPQKTGQSVGKDTADPYRSGPVNGRYAFEKEQPKRDNGRGNPDTIVKPERTGLSALIYDIAEAPRRAKERAEEIGEKAQNKYHEARVKPATQAALKVYTERMAENEQKYRKGEISEDLYKSRQRKYLTARDASNSPIEQRVVAGAIDTGKALYRGAVATTSEERTAGHPRSILEKVVEQDHYRPSPQPKFKPGRGTRNVVASKGGKGIDFGGGGSIRPLFQTNSSLFGGGREEPKKPQHRKKKGR